MTRLKISAPRSQLAFSMHDVKPAANNDGRTAKRVYIRELVKDEVPEGKHPDYLQERIWRQCRSCRPSVCENDQIMTKTAKKSQHEQ